MTRETVEQVIQALKIEVFDSVSSYFAPVRAVARDVAASVHAPDRHRGIVDAARSQTDQSAAAK